MRTFVYTGTEQRSVNPFRPGTEYGEADIIVMYVDAVIEEGKAEESYYRQKAYVGLQKAIAQDDARNAPNERSAKAAVDSATAGDVSVLENLRADLAIARARAKCVRVVLNAMYGSVYEGEEQHDE